MTNVIIIHGSYGNPDENWFPWLKTELEKIGHNVFVPKFPTPENQFLESWKKVFERYKKYINEETILVGHSTGAVFILTILEDLNIKIKASYLISGTLRLTTDPEIIYLVETFIIREFNWSAILEHSKRFFVYHSDDDPNVPFAEGKELAEKLNIEVVEVKNAGHFNQAAGYDKFELLLKDIKKTL